MSAMLTRPQRRRSMRSKMFPRKSCSYACITATFSTTRKKAWRSMSVGTLDTEAQPTRWLTHSCSPAQMSRQNFRFSFLRKRPTVRRWFSSPVPRAKWRRKSSTCAPVFSRLWLCFTTTAWTLATRGAINASRKSARVHMTSPTRQRISKSVLRQLPPPQPRPTCSHSSWKCCKDSLPSTAWAAKAASMYLYSCRIASSSAFQKASACCRGSFRTCTARRAR
mmetsp:Transcript_1195/g.2982  ORF Transcript_1195/g.2982 Transcript_1195/m.2982 type:complete len:222 (+) Transcript_1195:1435-2100(+)